MTMVMIFPSRREVSPAEKLRESPRLVLPRFCLETVALHPESFPLIFSRSKDTLYQKMDIGAYQVAHEAGGVPPHSWTVVGSPLVLSSTNIFNIFQN